MRQRHPLPSRGFALVENAELEDNGCMGKVVGCAGLSARSAIGSTCRST